MKIFLHYLELQDRKIDDPIVSGGGEMFCRLINENFDNVYVEQVPAKLNANPNTKDRVEFANKIILSAEKFGADIIISNYPSALFTGTDIQKSYIPIMVILHNVYALPSIITRIKNLNENGHSIFLVSNWQYKRYLEMAKRNNETEISISGFINPSYCKVKQQILDIEYECGTIGRCDNAKRPFLLRDMLKDTRISNLIITNTIHKPTNKSSYAIKSFEYYKKYRHLTDPKVLWDLSHDAVIENISKCGSYFSTWNMETWGITALESLSCGVPLILNSYKDGTHASQILPADKSHYKVIFNKDKESLINVIKSFKNVDRKSIQEMTWEKHSQSKWKQDLSNKIDQTIETFKNKRTSLLDFVDC